MAVQPNCGELPSWVTSPDLMGSPLNLGWLPSRSTQQLERENALDQVLGLFLLYDLSRAIAFLPTLVSPSENEGCTNSSTLSTLATHLTPERGDG